MIYTRAPFGANVRYFQLLMLNGLDGEQELMLQWSGTRCPASRAWTIPRGASDRRLGGGTPEDVALAVARRLEEIF